MSKRIYYVGSIFLLLLFFGRMIRAEAQNAHTFDEVYYLLQAALYWRAEPLVPVAQHPPLSSAIMGLPLTLLTDVATPPTDGEWLPIQASAPFLWQQNAAIADQIEWVGRYSSIILSMLAASVLGQWVWRSTQKRMATLLGLTLFTFDPNILAHSFLATTDLPLTAFFLLAAYRFSLFWHTPTWRNGLIAGVALGALCAVKMTALIFIVALGIMTVLRLLLRHESDWRVWATAFGRLAGWLAIAAAIFLLVYRFNWQLIALDWTKQQVHLAAGHSSFLLGESKIGSWWYYFPFAFLVKTPLGVLALLIGAVGRLVWRRQRTWEPLWPLLLASGIMGAAIVSNINIGYRTLLPLLPLLYVVIATAWADQIPPRPRFTLQPRTLLASAFVLGCVFFVVVASVRIGPHYLAYFNRIGGGPDNGWRLLIDSNIDWGQDLEALVTWTQHNQPATLHTTWLGNKPLSRYGVAADLLPGWPHTKENAAHQTYYPANPAPGTYAISVTQLQGTYLPDQDRYRYFRERTPTAKAGYSIFIYDVGPTGQPVQVALSGIEISDIGPDDHARWQTNDVHLRWFDARRALVLPTDPAWLVVGDGHLPADPLLRDLYPAASYGGNSIQREASFTFFDAGNWSIDPAQLEQQWGYVASDRQLGSADWAQQTLISAETPPQFANGLALLGYHVDPSAPHALELLTVWQVTEADPGPIKSFVHLLDATGAIVAQNDAWDITSNGLRRGDTLLQRHTIMLENVPSGAYGVQLGLYDPDTFARYPLQSTTQILSDRLLLRSVTLSR